MISGIYELIDGCLVQQLRFETISNNLANLNTNGFRKDAISFNQALSMNYYSETDFTPGPVRHTGNELDVALEGKGFFKIQTPKGIRYTRDGAFSINAEGVLVTHTGDAVLGQNGPITINGGKVTIQTDGQVLANGQPVDQLRIVDFEKPQLLAKEGGSYYAHQGKESEIVTAEEANIKQSYIEGSNVNPTEEMIKMLEAFRSFESAQKAIQSIDEMTSRMVNDQGLLQ
ncbi:MAG: flagellar basal-body rod protein FlgF [Pseudomonadota bacterium]|uniref:Flagellar basal-body rod protein FlgF n=1 Tax=Candidatus Desulfatibia profunda TaxID=2841695 RepID=A0A8J6NVL1_9BACT|nr:flagellar basal-body rod protein FlgF [Candidatus Desulfatibia profunda]MBL7179789.1 flagellar basal-body rod protein FlgF [Desulfobacterales bacterium]MBU0699270.1 flagellar basal-body rod protein FlgF [Pseudomonadota bacterium]